MLKNDMALSHTHIHTVNEDFMMPLVDAFAFSSSATIGSLQCVQFTILNDNVIERNETFTVELREVDSVIFSQRDTTVVIQDNDCMLLK